MGGAQMCQDYRATVTRVYFLPQSPGVPGNHLINCNWMKG